MSLTNPLDNGNLPPDRDPERESEIALPYWDARSGRWLVTERAGDLVRSVEVCKPGTGRRREPPNHPQLEGGGIGIWQTTGSEEA